MPFVFLAAYTAVNFVHQLAMGHFLFLAAYTAVNRWMHQDQHSLGFLAAYTAVNCPAADTAWL
ncbi:hypothetical protein C4K39_0868 [Pseudomonas sessilinigenes]|nr:hypothetical protein C4K39_0868 [Pseudomonas sessilinigenes]